MTNFLEEEIPGELDDEGHDYSWYRRAKLKREHPDVDWDRLDLIISQMREVTRVVEAEVDCSKARCLLESGDLNYYLQNRDHWGNYEWLSGSKHRFCMNDVSRGKDEEDCDDYSFDDWFFKFVKRAIKWNREEYLQWLISFYRQMYRVNHMGTEEHIQVYFNVEKSLTTLSNYATLVDQPAVAELLKAEIQAMKEEDVRRSEITKFGLDCLRDAFLCGATVEEILDLFAEQTRLFGTLTLTAGDTPGITIEKLTSCGSTYDCYFYLNKWGPSNHHFSSACPLEVVVWEGHVHLVNWLLQLQNPQNLQNLQNHVEILLKAIQLAAHRPDASAEILPLLIEKLQAIEQQCTTLDSPPARNIIIRKLMKTMLLSCGSDHFDGQGRVNLSAAKLLLPVLQSYGVDVNAYLDNKNNDNGENDYGDEINSILRMAVMNLIRNDTVEGWELLQWVFHLPGLRHDSEVALDTTEKLPLHKEWKQINLFSLLGAQSYMPDPYGWAILQDDSRRAMEDDEIKNKVTHLIRMIDFLLTYSCGDVRQAINDLEEQIKNKLKVHYVYDDSPIEDQHVAVLRHLSLHWGVDVRNFSSRNLQHAISSDVEDALELLKRQQRDRWFMAGALENNEAPLRRLQTCADLPSVLATTYKDKCTLLHVAAKHGHTDVITWLMEHHVDAIDARVKDISGRTALSFARSAGFTAAEQAMQKLGASQTVRRFFRKTAMRLRCVRMADLRSSASTLIQKTVRRYQVSTTHNAQFTPCIVSQPSCV